MLKKAAKKHNQLYIIIATAILLALGLFIIINFELLSKTSDFEEESRLSNIKKEKKKDDDIYKTVGWIRVGGTKIDIPVVAITTGKDLPVTRERYSWTVNRDDKFYNSMRIYGHNVMNLSSTPRKNSPAFKRFEELMSFVYYDFAKENQYIQLTINNENHLYRIFSVAMIEYLTMSNLPVGDHSKDELKREIKLFKDNSIYDYNLKVTSHDNILSLVTCTRMFGNDKDIEIVVSAKEVDNKRLKRLSKLKKTKKYDEIIEALEGDESNEEKTA